MMRSVYSAILLGALLCGEFVYAQRSSSSQRSSANPATPKRVTREEAAKDADSLQKHTNIAFLVGIGDYDRGLTGLPPLKYPVPDITAIGGVLKQEGYEVALLTDRSATAGTIRETFRELTKALDQGEGTFLFYFSGHGFRSGSENVLATFGTTAADLANQGLSLAEVQEMLLATGAKRRMAFIDACRNNPDDTRSVGSAPRSFQDLRESEGLRILYSTAPGEVSYEDENLQHGVFSYFMLEGLRGKAANQADGLVTFDDLRDYVSREMKSYGVARRRVQKPYQLGDSTGDFLLEKRLDSEALQALSAPPAAPQRTSVPAAPPPPQPVQQPVAPISEAVVSRGTAEGGISGLVAEASGGTLVLNVGSRAGLKVGDRLEVERKIRDIKDPATGKVLRSIRNKVGEVVITDVEEGSSVGTFSGPTPAKTGDVVKSI